jgi:hypothetical protein
MAGILGSALTFGRHVQFPVNFPSSLFTVMLFDDAASLSVITRFNCAAELPLRVLSPGVREIPVSVLCHRQSRDYRSRRPLRHSILI